MSTQTTVVAAKIPVALAARLEESAKAQRLTTSLLLRRLIEREVDGEQDDRGPIEATTRARLAELLPDVHLDPRAAVAIELARRLDVDPSNGAQHSRELSRLLEDVEIDRRRDDAAESVLDELRARRVLKIAGYGVVAPDGRELSAPDPHRRTTLLAAREREALSWARARRNGAVRHDDVS